ncbi:hypothetical protein [Mucilaginibacter arboris]|uniref:Uncharacterized protein n=1 Tax=Mucilaginibacter arboris TaxID=2682090 RepID=A0A7K1SXF5_9SPHI|nr:hypothetical protein [Mucilaginibacter arboris]MVN21928.1 hypothetical protein [Mucilaginibacter arboris]
MNIALPTLVLLVFLVPGFLFRRMFYSGEFSEQYFKENLVSLIFPTLLTSIIVHLLCYIILSPLVLNPDTTSIGILISGTNNSSEISKVTQNVLTNYKSVLLYSVIASLTGAFGGLLVKIIIRNYKLDRKYKILRFQNEWHYLFSGELLDFPNVPGRTNNIDFVIVEALVSSDEGTILYSGFLDDYILSSSTGIDRIYLKDVRWHYIKDDLLQVNASNENKKEHQRFIIGDFFIIPFNRIINLNISYYSVEQESQSVNTNEI